MRISEQNVLEFFDVSGSSSEYTAVYFLKSAQTMDEAISNYFDRGCPTIQEPGNYQTIFKSSKPKPAPAQVYKGNEKQLRNVFTKVALDGVVSSSCENVETFCQELNISPDGYETYVLGYLGKCALYQHFEEVHVANLEPQLVGYKDVKDFIQKKFASFEGDSYYKFLAHVYKWVLILLAEVNKTVAPGQPQTTMTDVVGDIYKDVLKPEYQTPLFDQFIDYELHRHKQTLKEKKIMKDAFSFLPTFLETFKTLKNILAIKDVDEREDLLALPTIYTDFIIDMKEKEKKK
ncbi:hypothetical protein EIN_252310 [Entamoeba invadens IP1]|uniref:Uncharacterized protein n=2 Tax=Entamoeba invadens TaxID=33085 RepID=A0A0A1UHB2_ENTIV|nr:hypothetical protein EIN_252310 [Entamoeba invadens IP1]BAN40571.1 hypothetical protein [Entamoeba invadens]ELP95017.1 hypothetical protein EIN_252310 [Entamoeba invadens IP1]BAN40667.1 hypothetical protein [Entamoeba invadens]BAN41078.1 hypothetical protein [Entamoeba invadens]BAN41090.1 hypothetical protein [Entamoeba invadens]|eukprot:XP_004261788.1 hypothetical protein EIN_252310 [Entamoeba invadens IP1]